MLIYNYIACFSWEFRPPTNSHIIMCPCLRVWTGHLTTVRRSWRQLASATRPSDAKTLAEDLMDGGVSWVNVLVNRAVSNKRHKKTAGWFKRRGWGLVIHLYVLHQWHLWFGTFNTSMRSCKHNDPFEAICLQRFGCFSSRLGDSWAFL